MNEILVKNILAYDKSAFSFDQKIAILPNYNDLYDFFSLLLAKNSKLLDLGCGPANISRYLYDKNKSLKITCLDLSKEMLKIAQKYIPNAIFVCDNAINFDLNEKFNAVLSGFVMPYLTSEEVILHIENINAHLEKNGFLYMSFMNGEKITQETPSFNKDVTLTVHYHNQNKIEKILREKGFEILKKENLEYIESDGSITIDVVFICKKIN